MAIEEVEIWGVGPRTPVVAAKLDDFGGVRVAIDCLLASLVSKVVVCRRWQSQITCRSCDESGK